MKILVTGAAGYIGSHTVKALLEANQNNHNFQIVGIDNYYSGSSEAIKAIEDKFGSKHFKFIKCDLNNVGKLDEIFNEEKFDSIIHFAAFIEVFESMKKPLKYYQNNTANAINLISLAIDYGIAKFVFSSTAATYGEPKSGVVSEKDKQHPINPYGTSKLFVEKILQDAASAHASFKYAILRYFNVAGASVDGLLGQNYPNATHLVKVAVQTIVGKRDKMFIFGDDYPTKDGTCIRDYIHIEDLASAHISALEYLIENKSDIFNVGYGKGYSVKEVITAAKKVSGVDFNVEIAEKRSGDPAILISDASKLMNQTSWKPKYNDLDLIIKTALEWEKKLPVDFL